MKARHAYLILFALLATVSYLMSGCSRYSKNSNHCPTGEPRYVHTQTDLLR